MLIKLPIVPEGILILDNLNSSTFKLPTFALLTTIEVLFNDPIVPDNMEIELCVEPIIFCVYKLVMVLFELIILLAYRLLRLVAPVTFNCPKVPNVVKLEFIIFEPKVVAFNTDSPPILNPPPASIEPTPLV